jgi:hypothetical protein
MGSKPWTQADLNAYSMQKNISIEDLAARMNFAASHHQQQLLSPSDVLVYALRIRTGPFGDKAPQFNTLPTTTQHDVFSDKDWDSSPPLPINEGSGCGVYRPPESGLIYLNNSYPDILGPNKEDNWVVLLQDAAQDGRKCGAYKISNTIEEAKVDFTLSVRVTGLELDLGVEKGEKPLSKFFLRKRTIFFSIIGLRSMAFSATSSISR